MMKLKTRREEKEPGPPTPVSTPTTPSHTAQGQAVSGSQDVLLQMVQLFRDECEQRKWEDILRRQAEEQRFNRLTATLRTQQPHARQVGVLEDTGDPALVSSSSPPAPPPSMPVPKATVVPPPTL